LRQRPREVSLLRFASLERDDFRFVHIQRLWRSGLETMSLLDRLHALILGKFLVLPLLLQRLTVLRHIETFHFILLADPQRNDERNHLK